MQYANRFSLSDNFSKVHLLSIRNENKIYSAAEDGKIPWISCDDVGAVGFHALVGKWAITDSDPILLGPELLTYDEVRLELPLSFYMISFLKQSFLPNSG